MKGPEVVVVQTGLANTASVRCAFERLGARVRVSRFSNEIERADWLVLPGVGSFGAGMAVLREHGLVDVIRERFKADRPTLAICLGLQLLASESEESHGVQGLGVVEDRVKWLGARGVRVPQFGWNRVEAPATSRYITSGSAYFANSYGYFTPPPGWAAAMGNYGGPFVAAMERGASLACQFHPELSGAYGQDLLSRWLAQSLEVSRC